jgi:hypothetical protein
VRTELVLALGCTATAAVMMAVNRGAGMATMLAIGLAVQGLPYLSAPVVVAIVQSDLRRHVGGLVEPALHAEPVRSSQSHR